VIDLGLHFIILYVLTIHRVQN